MVTQPELTQVERDKLEINPDFDFREIARRRFEDIAPGELAMFKWSGVYPQLQPGFFMIRLVTPGGLMTTRQFNRAVELAEQCARGALSITTRQTLQFHWVRQQDLHKVLEGMAEVGVSTRNSCGDVPRNIVASSLTGVAVDEVGDAGRLLRAMAADPEIQNQRNLPRKHKISVACANEAGAQTLSNCQGWVPVRRGETVGWKFHAGGGLGAKPYLAKVIFDWVPEELVLPVARATVEAFRRHGDRRQRALARLKFVVDRLGAKGFADVVLGILKERGIEGVDRIETALDPTPNIGRAFLDGQETLPQRQAGRSVVRVMIPRAELRTSDSRALSRLADALGGGKLMFTNRQNLELHDVPDSNVPALLDALHAAGFRTRGHERLPDIVACAGTTMCKMGVSDTLDAHRRLYAAFAGDEACWSLIGPLRLHITGCPNNCAHAWTADIGLRGRRTRSADGSSAEGYTVLIGGKLSEAGRLGVPLCDVPAEELVPLIRRILDTYLQRRAAPGECFSDFCGRVGIDVFRELVAPCAVGEQ